MARSVRLGMGGRVIAAGVRAIVVGTVLGGCAYPISMETQPRAAPPRALDRGSVSIKPPSAPHPDRSEVVPASHVEPVALPARAGVDDLVALAVARNPRLAKATFTVDAARGRHIQAGLYPNPNLAINWDEVGDRTGPGGILTAPRLEQTIVTGRKLTLAQAVAAAEIDRAALALLNERYAVIAMVRAACFDVLVLGRRIETLAELVRLADEAVGTGKILFDNQKIARLDLVQLETERERFRAEAEAARRELPAAQRALAAAIGDPRLTVTNLTGSTETIPLYDSDRTLDVVLATHPELRSAQVGVERAQAALQRARAEVIPDVTIYTGYIRQDQNKSNDFALGASAPIPVWNRNQGNIRAAQAELGEAMQEVARVENDLADRAATALRVYGAARQRAEIYRSEILPRAQETYNLSLKAFQGGQFEYLRVIAAQRAVAEARLEYNKSLGEAWKGAAQLSGLLLEEAWPDPPREPAPQPTPSPLALPSPPTAKPGN